LYFAFEGTTLGSGFGSAGIHNNNVFEEMPFILNVAGSETCPVCTVTASPSEISVGDSSNLTAECSDYSRPEWSWSLLPENIVNLGIPMGNLNTATGLASGAGKTAIITATAANESKTSCSATVQVTSPETCRISISPPAFLLGSNPRSLKVTRMNSNGKKLITANSNPGDLEIFKDTCDGNSVDSCDLEVQALTMDDEKKVNIKVSEEANECIPGTSEATFYFPPHLPCSCGPADGKRYCNGTPPADADRCSGCSATRIDDENNRSYTWDCGISNCSAGKVCGWIETNP
jgi:hypothetical protein